MRAPLESPIVEAVTIPDPLAAARALAHLPHPFLFHSAMNDPQGRWSFFGADPFAVFGSEDYDVATSLWSRLAGAQGSGPDGAERPPFTGGIVGYWAYDFGRRLERLPALARDDLRLPDVLLGFYDVVGAFDHATSRAWLFSSGLPLPDRARAHHAERRIEHFRGTRSRGRWPRRSRPTPTAARSNG
jgi:para-aminobenzoate synthetase component 1